MIPEVIATAHSKVIFLIAFLVVIRLTAANVHAWYDFSRTVQMTVVVSRVVVDHLKGDERDTFNFGD